MNYRFGGEPTKRGLYGGYKRDREFGEGREGDGAGVETQGTQEADSGAAPGGG